MTIKMLSKAIYYKNVNTNNISMDNEEELNLFCEQKEFIVRKWNKEKWCYIDEVHSTSILRQYRKSVCIQVNGSLICKYK